MDKITTNEEFKLENTMNFLEKKLKNISDKVVAKQYTKKEFEQYQEEVRVCC